MFLVDEKNKLWLGFGDELDKVDAPEGGEPSRLGTIAKSTSTKSQENRSKRFELLNKIRHLYIAEGRKLGFEIPTKFHRTSLCKHACTGSGGVEINLLPKAKKSFYKGLQTCGSVWTCPVCSHKIQEIRRLELAIGLQRLTRSDKPFFDKDGVMHTPTDYQAVMITFTFPHKHNQKLKYLVKAFSRALNLLKSGDGFIGFKKKYQYLGQIRGFEVTHGKNGWHPHTHELWFVSSSLKRREFKKAIQERWVYACLTAGLIEKDTEAFKHFLLHSVDVKFDCELSDYLAKQDNVKHWGIDKEMVKSSGKGAKGHHPFSLADEGKSEPWIEYTIAMKEGRVRQLRWSPHLKEMAQIEDIQDERAAQIEGDEILSVVGVLNKQNWNSVLKQELRSKVLELAENGLSIDEIRSFILWSETQQNK